MRCSHDIMSAGDSSQFPIAFQYKGQIYSTVTDCYLWQMRYMLNSFLLMTSNKQLYRSNSWWHCYEGVHLNTFSVNTQLNFSPAPMAVKLWPIVITTTECNSHMYLRGTKYLIRQFTEISGHISMGMRGGNVGERQKIKARYKKTLMKFH